MCPNINSTAPGLAGLPCPCCPPAPPLASDSLLAVPQTPPLLPAAAAPSLSADPKDKIGQGAESNCGGCEQPEENSSDLFSASVSELRRKAQEHSAALWQLAQTVQQQQQQQQQHSSNFALDSDSDVKRNSDDDDDDGGGGGGGGGGGEAAK